MNAANVTLPAEFSVWNCSHSACYATGVIPRPLAVAAVAVLGLGVYLLVALGAKADPTAAATTKAPTPAARAPGLADPRPSLPATPAARSETTAAAAAPQGQAGSAIDPSHGQLALRRAIRVHPDPQLTAMLDQGDQAFARRDYKTATAMADKVLSKDPNNPAALRLMGSATCAKGDAAGAQKYYDRLPPWEGSQMKVECSRGTPSVLPTGARIQAELGLSPSPQK